MESLEYFDIYWLDILLYVYLLNLTRFLVSRRMYYSFCVSLIIGLSGLYNMQDISLGRIIEYINQDHGYFLFLLVLARYCRLKVLPRY
jgi:hypothetical protein